MRGNCLLEGSLRCAAAMSGQAANDVMKAVRLMMAGKRQLLDLKKSREIAR